MKARAKINISLDVLRKREDGYHDLSMIMQTIELYDKVNIKVVGRKEPDICLQTNLSFLPTDSKNLVYRVIEFMRDEFDIGEHIFVDLFKMIPIAAGLAGGSADAAATIQGMNELFKLKLSMEQMIEIGKRFGADIPYCIVGGTAFAEGIGDQITFLKDFPKCYILIAKPNISVSTATIFKNLQLETIKNRPDTPLLLQAVENGELLTISKNLCNVLEEVTIKEHPYIGKVKATILQTGALGALMSGSGSAVFGIYEDMNEANKAAGYLKKKNIVRFAYATTVYNREKV